MNLDHTVPGAQPERYELLEPPAYNFELDRREFFALLGGGVLVCLALGETSAQQPGRGRGQGGGPQDIGAWLHIGEDGRVKVFAGKVEIGQNIRTSLSQVVAEELRLPVDSIQLVLADTDLTPVDAGTFGSRTTPDTAARLRRVAAAARETLVDLAAEQAKVERSGLAFALADGKVTHIPSNRSFTFGDLTKGKKLTKTVGADAPVTPNRDWKVAGKSQQKVDGRALVTGKHKFASDVKRPGLLYGKVLRAPARGSTLETADLKAAQALPGVVAVRDGAFVGVAASSELAAEQALAAIRADWKSTTSPSTATSENLYDELKKGSGKVNPDRAAVTEALAKADHKVVATYKIAYIAHAPMEPRVALAEWTDGKLTVWTGTQRPFGVRGELAQAFGIPQDRVRVIVPDMGSGYGGKHQGEAALEAARLAKAANKPVRVAWTRQEEFAHAYFRPAGVIDVSAGVSKEGKITAWSFHNYNSGQSSIRPLYDIANQETAFHGSRTILRQGSYRGLAATSNTFARECHIDDLAKAVGTDPLEFRLQNLKDQRLRAVLEAAAKQFGWGKAKAAPGQGFGIAGGFEKGSYVATCAEVAVDKSSGAVLNPDQLKNQVEGGCVMGLGGALFEEILFDGTRLLNGSFAKYRVPRFRDMPTLETVLVDRKDLPSAGAGETPIVAVAPAIGNAILQATGQRIRSLPMVPRGLEG